MAKIQQIPETLVGQKASLIEGVYSDLYLNKLNRLYSLSEILGKRKEEINEWGKKQDAALGHLVMDSPLGMHESEAYVLVPILRNSVKAGLWQPEIIDVPKLEDAPEIKTAERYLEEVDRSYKKRWVDEGVLYAIKHARNEKFVLTTSLEENVIVLPSQRAIEYFATRR